MDATTRKLAERIRVLEYEKWRAEAEIESIKVALRAAGVRLESIEKQVFIHEPRYVSLQMFEGFSLRESCEEILQDHPGQWFSKSDIEYLIVRGGYKFSTEDSKNSVAVTLQRMKEDGRCEVERARGARGNRYRWRTKRQSSAAHTTRRSNSALAKNRCS